MTESEIDAAARVVSALTHVLLGEQVGVALAALSTCLTEILMTAPRQDRMGGTNRLLDEIRRAVGETLDR